MSDRIAQVEAWIRLPGTLYLWNGTLFIMWGPNDARKRVTPS